MNRTRTITVISATLLGLALVAAPTRAEEYVVEPIVDDVALSGESAVFTEAELDQLLAPIALYPDALLSQVLIAATYPLEIVAAARWSRANPGLQGEAAVKAVADQDWDPSVKSLVAFPDLLAQMDQDLEWTRQLGEAMLLQESDVMDSIQFLRAKADEAGNLRDTEQVRVVREERTIVIEPARERVVYVPYYDTRVVYGSWWRPAYPPIYWAHPPYYSYYASTGFYWSSGIHISAGFFFSDFYWPRRNVIIVHAPRYYRPSPYYYGKHRYYVPGERWRHNPWHRRSVKYHHPELRERYEPRIRPPSARYNEQRVERRGGSGAEQRSRSAAQPQRQARQQSAARNYRELESTLRAGREPRERALETTRRPSSERQARVERQLSTQRDQRAAPAARTPLQREFEGSTRSTRTPSQSQSRAQPQNYRTTRQQAQAQTQTSRSIRQQAPSPRAEPRRQVAPTRQAAPARQAAPSRQTYTRPPSSGNARSTRPPQVQAPSGRSRAEAPRARQGNSGSSNRGRRELN